MSDRTTALEAFRTWIKSALSLADGNVIFAEQPVADVGRPSLPYVTIEQTADVQYSATPDEHWNYVAAVGDPGDPDYVADYINDVRYYRRRATIQVVYYGSNGMDAMLTLRDSLRCIVDKTSAAATLRTAGLVVRRAGEILDTTALRSTVWEPSASQEWWLYYSTTKNHSIQFIDTVTATIAEA